MFGIYVNSPGCIPYAQLIAAGYKTIETRSRNMLWRLVGKRVAIVRTLHGKNPVIVGYVTIESAEYCKAENFDSYRDQTLIPVGSKYDCHGSGKWLYHLSNPETCAAHELPKNVIKHGRSYCEF